MPTLRIRMELRRSFIISNLPELQSEKPCITEAAQMTRFNWLFPTCCIFALLVTGAQGAIFASDITTTVSIKYDNGVATVGEQFMRAVTGKGLAGEAEIEPPAVPINVITITDPQGNTYSKNIQTPLTSNIYVSARSKTDTDVMQTTTEPGHPVLEIYWGYEQGVDHPWRYYMRVNRAEDTQAVYSDFTTKVIWTRPITPARTAEIITSGTIPAWGAV